MLAAVIGLYVVSADAGHPSYLLSRPARRSTSTPTPRSGCSRLLHRVRGQGAAVPGAHLAGRHHREGHPRHQRAAGLRARQDRHLRRCCAYCLGLFPDASQWATPVVVALALISIVYGALVAIGQDDILRLIGLTSLSHFGFIVLGIFVFTSQGGSGSILYMVNHGVGTAALFLVAGLPDPAQGHRLDRRRSPASRSPPRCSPGSSWSSGLAAARPARAVAVRLRDPGDHRGVPARTGGSARSRSPAIVLAGWSTCSGCTSAR